MDFVKMVHDGISYGYNEASDLKMCILGRFFYSDVGCGVSSYKKWVLQEGNQSTTGNITFLDKIDNMIYMRDLFSEEETPTELIMSVQQFIQLFDEWQKICQNKPKNVLIKHENDQFIIETSD